jgi:hypothetical protein
MSLVAALLSKTLESPEISDREAVAPAVSD